MPLPLGSEPTADLKTVRALDPTTVLFIVVSFEGPDRYSQAGGLGVRISGLARTLAELDYETHLFFIGDPSLPAEERNHKGRLTLHRWAQWLSTHWSAGVYAGERAKVDDLTASLPPYIIERLVIPAIRDGRVPVIVFEEWQTAACAGIIAETLRARGLRNRVLMAWNANHFYGFETIDWGRLSAASTITTVSRHMRSVIRCHGVDATVIPNGIPEAALDPAPRRQVAAIRSAMEYRPEAGLFFKMARYEHEKGWKQALDAVSATRETERPLVLVARGGGPSGGGGELAREGAQRRLRVVTFPNERTFLERIGDCMNARTDIVNLGFCVSPALGRTLYAASDGVLANSISEPFGLVGLEAMAAGGVAFTSGTGEDYAVSGRNAVVLETLEPGEIVSRWQELARSPNQVARIRRTAKKTARQYEWRAVVEGMLMRVLERQALRQGLLCSRTSSMRLAAEDVTRRRPGGSTRGQVAREERRPQYAENHAEERQRVAGAHAIE